MMPIKARFQEAKWHVRGFSKQLAEEDSTEPLERAIIRRETLDEEEENRKTSLVRQWQGLFHTDSAEDLEHLHHEERRLETAARELAKAWSDFQSVLPPEHRSRVDTPPDITVVWKAVLVAEESFQEQKETRMGKAKQAVFKACESLEDHKELFHIFPTGDKYVSLVTGSISAIVKAAVNHQAVATGVSKILADIWDDIKHLRGLISGPFNNDPVRPYVAVFYTEVFKVLVDILVHWHQSRLRRALHSFNFGYVEKLVGKARSTMKELMTKVERQMQLERWNKIASKDDLLPIGEKLQLLLREQARMNQSLQMFTVESNPQGSLSLDVDETKLLPVQSDCSSLSPPGRTMSDFKDSAEHLRSYLQDVYYASLKDQTHDLLVNFEVLNTVRKWVTTPKSSCLWVDGPFNAAVPSQNTLMSSSILDTIRSMDLPVISYSTLNSWEYETDPPGDSEFVRMVSSLLYQLLQHIPDSLQAPATLDYLDISSLDG
ncbi:uncharacterized protein LDX57_006989 [Aspergillus melleus]|uniref:uncharacterized protein n=1 Tax=Aspergillus melleus TaxID=138277 RepID=UPI001E8D4A57|nr:uncharacterized protein LDX57_006989 [Aspergillus melleus]KAH8429322.1 hypothetical protein LDX57_006989 [Aspergillus melleus]